MPCSFSLTFHIYIYIFIFHFKSGCFGAWFRALYFLIAYQGLEGNTLLKPRLLKKWAVPIALYCPLSMATSCAWALSQTTCEVLELASIPTHCSTWRNMGQKVKFFHQIKSYSRKKRMQGKEWKEGGFLENNHRQLKSVSKSVGIMQQ